ncbi:MAG: LemA family protein [Firmicutes bacterium]|nr:LemA family protein [Bacillota bacterium]
MVWVAIIIAALAVIIVIYGLTAYNGFIRMVNRIDEAYATMDVYLKKRYDLIPNLVNTVKGYAAHEQETLDKVIKARNTAQGAATVEDKIAGENALSGTLKTLFAVAEAYPDLKANTNFINLQQQLQNIEGEIANSRKYYNAVVREYNTKTQVFPSSIIAGMFKFAKKTMFEINNAEERENVTVQF